MTIKIFDTKATIFSKNKAFQICKEHNFFFEKNSINLIEKILELKKKFSDILLITSDNVETIEKIEQLDFKKLTILTQYKNIDKVKTQKKISKVISNFEDFSIDKKFDLSVLFLDLWIHLLNQL